MSKRELVVLGTSSQVPTRHRNHNGYFLHWDEEGFLFDPGEGTQRQMIYANVSTSMISKIFITHFHGDHCLGLAGISQRISLDRVSHPIEIYYPASGQQYYERLRKASIFYDVAKIVDRPISQEGVIFENQRIVIETRTLDHCVDTWGYRIREKDSRTMLVDKLAKYGVQGAEVGKLIREGKIDIDGKTVLLEEVSLPKLGQSFAFVMDTRMCQAAIELARDVDILVCESTYLSSEEEEARAHGHLTAAQAATIAREAKANKLVLAHFSQRYPNINAFLQEAQVIHPNAIVTKDGQRIPLPKRKREIIMEGNG